MTTPRSAFRNRLGYQTRVTNCDTNRFMGNFRIFRGQDVGKSGKDSARRVINDMHTVATVSIRTGYPYQTSLDPPPADPRCCHPPREEMHT